VVQKRKRPRDEPGPTKKLSLLLTSDLATRLRCACEETGLTASKVVRRILDDGLDRYARPDCPARMALSLSPTLADALAVAGRLTGLDPAAVIQLILADHIADFIARARERAAALQNLAAEDIALRTPPNPG
jgi:hypothetical protein